MPRDFFPRREFDVRDWSRVFRNAIVSSGELYGISPEQAAAYAILDDEFNQQLLLSSCAGTRTEVVVEKKNQVMKSLEQEARKLARLIRGQPQVTAEMRCELGLSRPREGKGSPTHVPKDQPLVIVESVLNRTISISLRAPLSIRPGRPTGASSAAVFSFLGESAPADINEWRFHGNTTRARMKLSFDVSHPPGTQVWIVAYWVSPRGEPGPCSNVVHTYLSGGAGLKGNFTVRRAA